MTVDDKIIGMAVDYYNGKDYSSLQYAIKHYNILDDEADKKFDQLLPEFLERIG